VLITIIVVIVVALLSDRTNGFHDAANAIATSVATRALTPRVALAVAAVMNLVGAFLGTQVASTVGSGIIAAPQGTRGLLVVLAALLGRAHLDHADDHLGDPGRRRHPQAHGGALGRGRQHRRGLGVDDPRRGAVHGGRIRPARARRGVTTAAGRGARSRG